VSRRIPPNEVLRTHTLNLNKLLYENQVGNVLLVLVQTLRSRGKDGVLAGGVAAFLAVRSDSVQKFRTVSSTKDVVYQFSFFSCIHSLLACTSTAFAA
jgi:hypothetical protein